MKTLTKYQLAKASKNIDNVFNNATKQDIANGLAWYKTANDIANDIAAKNNITPFTAASIISALSPQNKWHQNIKDAYKLCESHNKGLGPNDIKVSTFNSNKFKAFEIIKGNVQITEDSRKTYSFVQNVGNLNENFITIDLWHLRVCFGKTIETGISKPAYDQITKLTLKKAKKFGLKGYELQAILWVTMQRLWIDLK